MARELLRQVRVASPCHISWSEMEGDERVRFCKHCKHNVFNLSDMTDKEAEGVLRKANGRLCVRYYQRADGTVMTRNCPVGMAAVRRRLAIGLLAAAALVVSAFGMVVRPPQTGKTEGGARTLSSGFGESGPWKAFYQWLLDNPEPEPQTSTMVVGALAPMPSKGP